MWDMLRRSLSLLSHADQGLFGGALAMYLVSVYLMAWRWRTVLLGLGCAVRTWNTLLANLAFTFANNITPGRVGGEVLRVAVLRHQTAMDLKPAVASSLYDRSVDLVLIPVFMVLSLPALAEVRRRLF